MAIARQELKGDTQDISTMLDLMAQAGVSGVRARIPGWYKALIMRLAREGGLRVWVVVHRDGETELDVASAGYPDGGTLEVAVHGDPEDPKEVLLTWEGAFSAASGEDATAVRQAVAGLIAAGARARSQRRMDQ